MTPPAPWLATFVTRWHSGPSAPWLAHTQDRIGGHSGRMGILALHFWPDCSRDLLVACLCYDLGECIAGDAPAPAKRDGTLRSALDTIENCLRLYSKPGDVVMDPFNGIGSTGYQAVKMYRRYLGFELKPEYAKQADKNLKEAEASVGDLFGSAA